MADNIKGIPFSCDDEGIDFPTTAKQAVQHVYNVNGVGTPKGELIQNLELDEIYVVWFGYVLGHWKAILSTSRPDGRIYEVTHKPGVVRFDVPSRTFVDSYLKTHNIEL